MKDMLALNLAKGQTTHYRASPFRRAFSYPVKLIDLDIDRLSELKGISRFFSVDAPNILSFQTNTRGNRGEQGIETWPREKFESAGIETSGKTIRLITFPSTLGYSFSPLSLWLLLDADGAPVAMIYEVNNTFGDDHSYIARLESGSSSQLAQKSFYVSPFFDVEGNYRFTLDYSPAHLKLLIDNLVDGERMHSATLDLHFEPATSKTLTRFALGSVLSGLAVITRIHLQAVQLWMRGARYHSRKSPTRNGTTLARVIQSSKSKPNEGAL